MLITINRTLEILTGFSVPEAPPLSPINVRIYVHPWKIKKNTLLNKEFLVNKKRLPRKTINKKLKKPPTYKRKRWNFVQSREKYLRKESRTVRFAYNTKWLNQTHFFTSFTYLLTASDGPRRSDTVFENEYVLFLRFFMHRTFVDSILAVIICWKQFNQLKAIEDVNVPLFEYIENCDDHLLSPDNDFEFNWGVQLK